MAGKNEKQTLQKLEVLGEAAKYDTCASSASKRSSSFSKIGNVSGGGICHSYTPDGRCISLLKVLMTNYCENDCLYCVNRKSNNIKRVSFEVDELANLFMGFYKRNYVEGLFLSSGVCGSADITMEKMIQVIKKLRNEFGFGGYIHLKAIPGCSEELLRRGAELADRMSVNLESPNSKRLALVSPEKSFKRDLVNPMEQIKNLASGYDRSVNRFLGKVLPAGQTTQLVVGAAGDSDKEILDTSSWLYNKMSLRRVYYSAFIPVEGTPLEENSRTPLRRENRLFQADWLFRFYKFRVGELIYEDNGNLSLDRDPKLNWAYHNLDKFPWEINKLSYDELLRIPGLGPTSARRITNLKRFRKIKSPEELKNIGVVLKRALDFITVNGRYYGGKRGQSHNLLTSAKGSVLNTGSLRLEQVMEPVQLSLSLEEL